MRKQIKVLAVILSTGLLAGCGIFPKEEELQKTPIIQAYEQEPFRKVQVKKGDMKLYEKVDAVCMNLGEKRYTFSVEDMAFKGIYVTLGEQVQPGKLLADLAGSTASSQVANAGQLQLIAEEEGTVTFVKDLEDGEKAISGQIIVITNSSPGYYLNAYTKYWDSFHRGDQIVMRIRGKEYTATIVQAEDLGLPVTVRPTDPEETSEVYFHIQDQEAYLQSGDNGSVTILVEEKKNVLYVPKGAVTTVNDQKIVYIEDKNGIRGTKEIETGMENDRYIEVTKGLSEGDSIIIE